MLCEHKWPLFFVTDGLQIIKMRNWIKGKKVVLCKKISGPHSPTNLIFALFSEFASSLISQESNLDRDWIWLTSKKLKNVLHQQCKIPGNQDQYETVCTEAV